MAERDRAVGPYELDRLLATGSQSQVWRAIGPDGEVALKLARTDAHRAALRREVGALQLGPHPGLPELIDHDPDFGWVALGYIKGSQIDQWAQVQEVEDVVDAAGRLLDVLSFLHGHGLLHGDIKPSNVLVDAAGRVRLIDLGVASAPEDRPEGFTGTLGYAAPELLKGAVPRIPQADLYGMGALLYTCLTGRPPFVAADPAALTYLPLVSLPPPASSLNTDIPEALDELLARLLARDPDRRPATVDEVRALLDAVQDSVPPRPVLGMDDEREALRRAVVGAADGEPRVVVLYGPPGSGRRTLIAEAVAHARREGIAYHKTADIQALLDAIRAGDQVVAAVLRGTSNNAQKLASVVLRDRLPCLLLLHSDRPLPALTSQGAIELTPAPLSAADIARLARLMGADEDLADTWRLETLGLPAAVLGRIRAWRREELGDEPSLAPLPPESRHILEELRRGRVRTVPDLARATEHSEHALLDHCEVLFAEGLIEPADDGQAVRLTDAGLAALA